MCRKGIRINIPVPPHGVDAGGTEKARLAAGRKWRFKAVGGSRGKSNLGATPRADDVAVWPEATDAPLPRKAPLLAEPCGARTVNRL
jgi:hypothetical protein